MKNPITVWQLQCRFLSLAVRIALMRQERFNAMIDHLEANALANERFQEVISLAKECRARGPLAVLLTKRADQVSSLKSLKGAYTASIVFEQMKNQL